MLLVVWVIICFAPALWEYRLVLMSSSWAESKAGIVSVTEEPSKSLSFIVPTSTKLVTETVIEYQYTVGAETHVGKQRSLPHLDYLTHFPTELVDDFKVGSTRPLKYNSADVEQSVIPNAANSFTIIACMEAVILCIVGAIFQMIWSIARPGH